MLRMSSEDLAAHAAFNLDQEESHACALPPPFDARRARAIASLLPAAALAQTPAAAAPAPEPEFTFTGNVGLYSQYVFRGISQTNEKPAVQGGFDLGHKSGFYVGTWASNDQLDLRWLPGHLAAASASSSMEWDFYGGYKGSLPADFGYDLGVLYYWYPGKYPSGLHEAEHDRALRRADLEVPVAQVQLQRQRQDLRPPGFARLAATST